MFKLFKRKKPAKWVRRGDFIARYKGGYYDLYMMPNVHPYARLKPNAGFEPLQVLKYEPLPGTVQYYNLEQLLKQVHRELFKLTDSLPGERRALVSIRFFSMRPEKSQYELTIKWDTIDPQDGKPIRCERYFVMGQESAHRDANLLGIKIS